MRRLRSIVRSLLLTSLLLAAGPAHAGPVVAAAAAAWSWISGAVTYLAATTWGAIALNVGASLLLNAIVRSLAPSPPQLLRELQVPSSRPPYRYIYGHARVYGSWAPLRVKNGVLYGCMILNSRPSAGNFSLFLDKRPVTLTGDLYDFSGAGASATNNPFSGHVRVWAGLGDQTGPPDQILSDAPEFFESTDAWQGRTVMWFRIDRGPSKSRADRWPRVPPEVEVEGDWSLVWNPRDSEQAPDDPSTWTYSANQALCLLDALRTNPIRRYALDSLLLDTFVEGADIADELVSRRFEGPEPRYEANGWIVWRGGEIVDQIAPLAEAGAGDLMRVGGRLGYAAGAWREPIYTITDLLADAPVEYDRWLPSREIPNAIRAKYVAPARDWQEAELPYVRVPGMQDPVDDEGVRELPLGMVTSPTQAMRIQQILARRAGAQKRLSCVLPPDAFDLVAGVNVLAALPPSFSRLNGLWQVRGCSPAAWLSDVEGGVAMRIPATLAETAAEHYDWNPETDEFDLATAEFDPDIEGLAPPTDLAATSGPDAAVGEVPRIRFSFEPSVSSQVAEYEWEWRETGGTYQTGGVIGTDVLDDDDRAFGFLVPVLVGTLYDVRVRSNAPGRVSEWEELTDIVALPPDLDLGVPLGGNATGGAGQIVVSWSTPNSADFHAIEFWGADADDVEGATLLELRYTSANTEQAYTDTGLGAAVTRYYWARSRGPYGSASSFTASVSATTDP